MTGESPRYVLEIATPVERQVGMDAEQYQFSPAHAIAMTVRRNQRLDFIILLLRMPRLRRAARL